MTPPRRRSLGRLLFERERWLDEALRRRLQPAGRPALARAHTHVFANLDADGTRISELARRAGVTKQAIQRTVAELERLGLVELAADPANRSAKLVLLTASGHDLDRAARDGFTALEQVLEQRLGRDQVRALRAALEADWGDIPG